MAHQSLYRRYRPRRFADVRGQEHVIGALRNAVANGTEGHAYLFSGPRGTGKTSTARILAKALNCPNLTDGEPCAECDSCLSIENGSSYDLFELDAASNNGVDAMRDLISRTVVGSPGRTKVYILDEVHMLSAAASNALLKTLEEPPDHVTFVLATTDPQKVLPTIRSRTQHFEFSLLSATELSDYVSWIRDDAGLDFDDDAIAHVVRQGRGSARDTLSALDMVVAAGGVSDKAESVTEIIAALAERDTGRVMAAVSDAVSQGREPRVLAETLLASLRDAFLTSVNANLDHLSDADQASMNEVARSLGTATITRALESIGMAIVEMRQAADPRVPLEVALIKLTTPAASTSLDALLERIEDLELRIARGIPAAPAGGAATLAPAPELASAHGSAAPAAQPDNPEPAPSAGAPSSPAAIRAQLAARKGDPAPAAPRPTSSAPAAPQPAPAPTSAPQPPVQATDAAPTPTPTAPSAPTPAPQAPQPSAPRIPSVPSSSAPAPRPEPAPVPAAAPQPAAAAPPSSPEPAVASAAPASGAVPSTDEVSAAMTEAIIPTLSGMNKSLFAAGRIVGSNGSTFEFALDNAPDRLLNRAQGAIAEIEAALSARFGQPIQIHLTNHAAGASAPRSASSPPAPAQRSAPGAGNASTPAGSPGDAATPVVALTDEEDDEEYVDIDLDELEDADDIAVSGVDKVIQAFPGAVIIEEES